MTDETETTTDLAEHGLPFGRQVRLKNVDYHNGLNMLRLIWREGKRLTIVDLDPEAAARLGADLNNWAGKNTPEIES